MKRSLKLTQGDNVTTLQGVKTIATRAMDEFHEHAGISRCLKVNAGGFTLQQVSSKTEIVFKAQPTDDPSFISGVDIALLTKWGWLEGIFCEDNKLYLCLRIELEPSVHPSRPSALHKALLA